MAKIAILGAGIMATALTFPLTENGHEVHLVGTHLDQDIIASIQKDGTHPNLGLKVNDGVTAYQLEDADEAFEGADVAMSGVNSFGVHFAGKHLSQLVKPGMRVLSITKGMEADEDGTLHMLPDVLKTYFTPELRDSVSWSAIVGPSIAGELAVHHDTCVVFCGEDQAALDYLAGLFRTDYYHVWTSTDFLGHEIGACMKNIYAFAAGLGQGLTIKEGKQDDRYIRYNYNAAVFAQGQKELRQFMQLLGGVPETSDGLGGVGDMFVTSMGGRNVRAGEFVGQGRPFSEVRDSLMKGVTLEGVNAIRVVGGALKPLTERGVVKPQDFPLCRYLYSIIEEDAPLDMPWSKFFGGEK
ncbi:NAD(P)H-dependent glycerol-3-phosphate dehydrogenase [Gleimia hominis]|uniref:Glycerol-3-phosphate dehydrogenase n=1 Tax=Gleimia hominis TaxID=595468 RepID=A0ABU3IBW2_9ACTO|nr:2-dehydropantoate 2-reductase N-terminal domain-containing protein [Gleimia hominis]MDT3767862.1 glycerol-3-phosphate dehydrogenase [Gleimia hominis]WIK63743.1 glycerol-3-phosphate dehydrogenase [Gleimia hominis]